MRFYNSIGPNPRAVRMFAAEKGIDLPRTEIDIRGGENRRDPYLSRNPAGTTPALELDDGRVISEITAICEYLDETISGPSLVGATPEERAETRMWMRRIDLGVMWPMGRGFQSAEGLSLFQDRVRCLPGAAADLKLTAQDGLRWLNKQMAGKEYIAGSRLTLADIMLFAYLDFFSQVGQPLDPELPNIGGWYDRMKARPSAAA